MCTICGLNRGTWDVMSARGEVVQICECCKNKFVSDIDVGKKNT